MTFTAFSPFFISIITSIFSNKYGNSHPLHNPSTPWYQAWSLCQPYKSYQFLLAEVLVSLMPFVDLIVFSKLDGLEEILGVVGLSGLGHVFLDG